MTLTFLKSHPDNGGSEEATKAINVEYEKLFKILKDSHARQDTTDSNAESNHSSYGNSYDNMKYDFAEDELLREMLQKVIYLSDITIEIISHDTTYLLKSRLLYGLQRLQGAYP